jgi:cell division septation protein DedD
MADEGFHEIQLGKKQLFFAFMAAALFAVVVFSLGVWVGQDVRRPDSEIAAEPAPDAPADSTPEPTKLAPNELDYAARLSDGKAAPATATATPAETKPIEPPSPPDAEVAPAAQTQEPANKKAAATKAAPTPVEKSAPAAATPPPPVAKAGTITLQVSAFNDKATAQNLAARLKAKGYAAYVFTAPVGPSQYKVRVGPLADKAETDKVMARLKKEEGFSPFITR